MELSKPRNDDRKLWDVIFGIYAYPAVLLAHHLKLFSLLAKQPRSLDEVATTLGIAARPTQAILSAAASLGFLHLRDDRYALTPIAEDYLLEDSPTYFGRLLDLIIDSYPVASFESIKRAVLTDSAQVIPGREIYESNKNSKEGARAFTRAMHSHSMAAALAWPDKVDLSRYVTMLDIGGGSGAHSIAAALRWPNLRATVFDLGQVCEVARELITGYQMTDRVGTQAGDMWADPFPAADVHLYSAIFMDWPPERCRMLARKSFESLPRGGRIIVHQMLYNDDKTGPFAAAAFSIIVLLFTSGQSYTGQELTEMLTAAGFTNIAVTPTFGYWSMVTAVKP